MSEWTWKWALVGDEFRRCVVESAPEAHMMSAPITVGVDYGNAVSDLCEQVQTAEAERDALRAEVERLKQRFRQITFTTNDDGDLVLISEQDEDGQILRVMWERKERLRKGKDETVDTKPLCQAPGMAQALMRAGRAGAADLVLDTRKGKDDERSNSVGASGVGEGRAVSGDVSRVNMGDCLLAVSVETLDHRLGTPQPDGEPCEPMSAWRWRWLP
jgi:hypothetical protein